MIGEQRKGFVFGESLAELLEEPVAFINNCLSFLKTGNEDANPILLSGFLSKLTNKDRALFSYALNEIISSDQLIKYAIPIVRLVNPSQAELEKLITLLREGRLEVGEFRSFSYNSVLSHLNDNSILWFAGEIQRFGVEGSQVALEILHHSLHGEFERLLFFKELLEKIIKTDGLLRACTNRTMEFYSWESIAIRLLNEDNNDLALHITKEIISLSEEGVYLKFDLKIVKKLLAKYLEEVWPYFSKDILSDDWRSRTSIVDLFSADNSLWLQEIVPDEFLIEWCIKNSEKAPGIIPNIAPMFIYEGANVALTPLANFLLDKFPNDEVLAGIWRNTRSTSWVGSINPHLKT